MSDVYDACVIGGGPAGATLALRLAQLGRKVALVEKVPFPRAHIGETLSLGVIDLLDVIGLRQAVDKSRCFADVAATINWAGDVFERNSGYQVERGCFDALLLAAAADAGVVIYQPDLIIDSNFSDGSWHLFLRSGRALRARYVADAGGRSNHGALALRANKAPIGVSTFAIYAYWRGVDSGDRKVLIEAGTNQWYWASPVPNGPFVACAFVDKLAVVRESGRYMGLMAESLLISRWLGASQCRLAGEVRVCDATPYMADTPVTERWILVGDSALSLDPLSSQGTQVAMSTALRAASVVHTILDRPGQAKLAMTFYRDRIADLAKYHRAITVASYRRHFESVGGSAFWRRRSGGNLMDLGETRANYASRPNARFRVSTDVSFVKVGAIDGDYIVEVEAIEIAGRIFAYLNGSLIARLLRMLDGSGMSAQDLVARWSLAIPHPIAIRVFQWSCREGVLTLLV